MLALGAIVVLCAIVVVVWVQFSQGAFHRRQRLNDINDYNITGFERITKEPAVSDAHQQQKLREDQGKSEAPSNKSKGKYLHFFFVYRMIEKLAFKCCMVFNYCFINILRMVWDDYRLTSVDVNFFQVSHLVIARVLIKCVTY